MDQEIANEDVVEDALELLGGTQDVDGQDVPDEADDTQDALDDNGQEVSDLIGDNQFLGAGT